MHHYSDIAAMEVRNQPDHAMVSFSVACLPIPQPRQRYRVIRGINRASYATNYTPAKHPVNGFKALVVLAARRAWTGEPMTGPVEIRVQFRFPLPAGAKAAIRRHVLAGGTVPHITKPDADNCIKSLTDCLTGICWVDDKVISRLTVEKIYAKEPGVDVWIATVA